MAEGGTINIPAPGILGNDTDVDGDSLNASLVSGPVNGSLTLNPDGSFIYTHDGSETSSDSFVYQVADGNGGFDTEMVAIIVTPVNDAPVANNESYSVAEDITLTSPFDVLANDADAEGDSLSISLIDPPDHAAAFTLNPNGSFNYVPVANFFGMDTFIYRIDDGNGGFDTATVTITVTPVNDAPVASPDLYTSVFETTVNAIVGVLSNDADVDGDPLTAILLSGPINGTLTLATNGTFVYTPSTGFFGNDTFSYVPNDGMISGAPVLVTIDVAVGVGGDGGGGGGGGGGGTDPPDDEGDPKDDPGDKPDRESLIGPSTDDEPLELTRKPAVLYLGQVQPLDEMDDFLGLLADRRQATEVLRLMAESVDAGLWEITDLKQNLNTEDGLAVAFDAKYLWQELDELAAFKRGLFENVEISIGAISAFATVGYILWSLRGGVLIAAALSQMPNWRLIDPLPVLESYEMKKASSGDDDINYYFEN